MTSEQEFSGKDIEEAINNACAAIALPKEHLNITVRSPGSNGIFGLLKKKAIIRVSVKEESEIPTTSISARTDSSDTNDHARGRKKRSPKEKTIHSKRPRSPQSRPRIPAKEVSAEIMDAIKLTTEKIIDLMGYKVQVSLTQEQGKILVQLSGDRLENLIGEEGSTLDALQYLVRKIASQKFSEKIMLSVDAGNFRENRKKELQKLALEMARLVKEGKKHKIIAPLNPAERRIIHVTLQTDSTIRSKSIGEGLFKKIKIYLPGQGRRHHGKRRPHNKGRGPKKQSTSQA